MHDVHVFFNRAVTSLIILFSSDAGLAYLAFFSVLPQYHCPAQAPHHCCTLQLFHLFPCYRSVPQSRLRVPWVMLHYQRSPMMPLTKPNRMPMEHVGWKSAVTVTVQRHRSGSTFLFSEPVCHHCLMMFSMWLIQT